MEEEGRCARHREMLRHSESKSHHEGEDPGWEDSMQGEMAVGFVDLKKA